MTSNKLTSHEKQQELEKFRDLVLATLDYYIDNNLIQFRTADFDPTDHFKGLKTQTLELYQKGSLTRLKQWFSDLTQMQVETRDLKFNIYLQEKTKYNIDIFKSYYQRVGKIIEKGKITTDNQFYEVNEMVDHLCQVEPANSNKIEMLNRLLLEYERRKSKRRTNPAK